MNMRQRRAKFNRTTERLYVKRLNAMARRQLCKIAINSSYGKNPMFEVNHYKDILTMMYGPPFQFQGRTKRYV